MSEQDVFDALKYRIEVDTRGTRWYYNSANQFHRIDGPAAVWDNGDNYWYQNGKLHRSDGPAIEYVDGHKEWWQNGQLHRTDGPAIEWADGSRYWWRNGQLHRTDGPAVEYSDGRKEWYINDKRLTKAEFLAATQPVIEMTVADVERLLGKRVKIIK